MNDRRFQRLFRSRLTRWFREHGRDLPWRRTRDPYAIWVSEIMLQQTQVATVIPYYQKFLARFPNITTLAAAEESELLRSWEGLGYYRRARQMHAAANRITEAYDGELPANPEELRDLPGIGRYTANAILSFSRGARLPILEANTIRVWCRLVGETGDPTKSSTHARLWQAAEAALPRGDSAVLNQSLIELGSLVCRPVPRCAACPVTSFCRANLDGRQAEIPAKTQRMNYESVTDVALVIRRGGRVFLRQCREGERWAGLWDYPRVRLDGQIAESRDRQTAPQERAKRSANGRLVRSRKDSVPSISQSLTAQEEREIARKVLAQTGMRISVARQLGHFRHGVTRFRIRLLVYSAQLMEANDKTKRIHDPGRWLRMSELDQLPQHVTGRKINALLQAPAAP